MFKLTTEIYDIRELDFWSGGQETYELIDEYGLISELQELIEGMSYEWTISELNDFLWFDTDYILECLGIETED